MFFRDGDARGDSHPEMLRQFQNALLRVAEEIAIIERLRSEIFEKTVTLYRKRTDEFFKIYFLEPRIKAAAFHSFSYRRDERSAIRFFESLFEFIQSQDFFIEIVNEKACGEFAVDRVALNARLDGHEDHFIDLGSRDAVVDSHFAVRENARNIYFNLRVPGGAVPDRLFYFPNVETDGFPTALLH